MELLREWILRMRAFFRKRALDRDFEDEVSSHIEQAVKENVERGVDPNEARREALVRFGGIEQAKEIHRAARGAPFLDSILQDLRYAVRTLRKDRSFTIIAVVILGLGIGANTAVFSVIDTILLRPLPFPKSQRLVWIAPPASKCGLSCETYSADAFQEFQSLNRSFQGTAGYFAFTSENNFKLTGRGEPVSATGIFVTGDFFKVLGVQPSLGRLFNAEDEQKGGHPAVLLSNAYWKRQFAASPEIVGKEIDLNGQSMTVAGVLPPSFDFGAVFAPGEKVDLFTPYIFDDWRDTGNDLTMVGRLKPGVTLAEAQADANLVMPQLYFNVKYPNTKGNYKNAVLVPLKAYVTGRLHRSLIVLWCAVGLILLIVCVNLANLLLGRAATRRREFAMRIALGAGRRRLIRQLLTESVVLAASGAVLGLGIAYAIVEILVHQGSLALPLLSDVKVDGAALGWTALLAAAAAVIFGLLPGFTVSRTNPQEALKDTGPGATEGRKHDRLRGGLVVSEVALACVLLIGAGLLLRSFLHVLDVNLGFEPSHAAAIRVDYNDGNSSAKRSAIFERILTHVKVIPGVEAAGMVDYLPLGRNRNWGWLKVPGKLYRNGEAPSPLVYVITPGFFRAMGMQLIAGRDFSWSDTPTGQKVVIINQNLARALWPHGDAVGQIVNGGPWNKERVVGVVGDVRETSVTGSGGLQAYYPASQAYPAGAELVVRSALPPGALAGSVMRTLRQLNPSQPAAAFVPIQNIVNHAVSPRRFFMLLVACFAALGLILAALGIYGVISYSVTRKTHEIGIRMALGASPSHVRLEVMNRTLRLALVGILAGVVASLAAARLMASMLFGVTPLDPATFAATIFVLALVAFLAGYLPARRASRVDPMTALRAE